MSLEVVRGWSTPIKPLDGERLWCVWNYGGVFEFMVAPPFGRRLIRDGMVVDGKRMSVTQVGDWPGINAIQIRVIDEEQQAGRTFVADRRDNMDLAAEQSA